VIVIKNDYSFIIAQNKNVVSVKMKVIFRKFILRLTTQLQIVEKWASIEKRYMRRIIGTILELFVDKNRKFFRSYVFVDFIFDLR
jgi:hypothetical protein